jgi:1,4-alpha-glucan branching enzyme
MNIVPQENEKRFVARFRLYAPAAQSVSVVGDFNGWKANDTPLGNEGEGFWAADVPLEPGSYIYMFVLNGREWIPDPEGGVLTVYGFRALRRRG